MPQLSQQEIERYYFERFREARNSPLPGTPRYGDKPDVILDGARKIGVEITNFYVIDGSVPRSEQRQSALREAVVARAQALYRQANQENIELLLGFDESHPVGDAKAQRVLVREMANFARKLDLEGENRKISRSVFKHIPELKFVYLLAHEVEYTPRYDPEFPKGTPMDFAGFREYRNRQDKYRKRDGIRKPLRHTAKWRVWQVHSPGLLSMDRLADIVKKKESRVSGYTTCDAYWLLVVVDFIDPAQEQEIRIDGLDHLRSEVFEKIIVYRTGFEHIFESHYENAGPV